MALNATSPIYVAGLLNNWYLHIENLDYDKSKELKRKVKNLLSKMDEDQTVLLYYSLLEYRHDQMFQEGSAARKKDELGDLLSYYYHFYNGMDAYARRHYDEAVKHYKKAEQRLASIPDNIEKAEFHYSVGRVFYHIRQNGISMSHAMKALNFFVQDPHYSNRVADCQLLLSLNFIQVREFPVAEDLLTAVIKQAREEQDNALLSIAYYNLGHLFMEWGKPKQAMKWLVQTLELETPDYKTLYLLAKASFQIDQPEAGRTWLQKGLNECAAIAHKEYWYRFKALQGVYGLISSEQFEKVMKDSIAFLEQENVWSYAEEHATLLANFYWKGERYKEACEYFHKADLARTNLKKRGL